MRVSRTAAQSNPVATRPNSMTVELEASVVVGISSFDLDEAEDLVAGVQVICLHPTP